MTAFTSGDHCRLLTVDGKPCAQHFDCDEWGDGVITSLLTGERVER